MKFAGLRFYYINNNYYINWLWR